MTAALAPIPLSPTIGIDRRCFSDVPPPAAPFAKPALLREWSHPPTTPLAVVRAATVDPGPTPPPPPPPPLPPPEKAAGSPLLALQNAWTQSQQLSQHAWASHLGQQAQQQGPVVATLVTNLACNLRSSIDHIYAGYAAPIVDEDDDTVEEEEGTFAGTGPPGPAAPFGPECAQAPAPTQSPTRDRLASDDSWVLDAYTEAEFHVVNGKLTEVSVPVPGFSAEDEEAYEEAMLKHRGRHCIRGSSGDGGKKAFRKNVGRVRKWMKRRREARMEHRRERKNSRELGKKDPQDLDDLRSSDDDPEGFMKKRRNRKRGRRGSKRGKKDPPPMIFPPAPPRPQEKNAMPSPSAPVAQCICRMGSNLVEPWVEPTAQVARFIGQYYHHHAGRYLTTTTAEGFLPAIVQDQVQLSAATFVDAIAEKIAKNDAPLASSDGGNGERSSTEDGESSSADDEKEKASEPTVDGLLRDVTSAPEDDDDDDMDNFEEEAEVSTSQVPRGSGEVRARVEEVRVISEKEGRTDDTGGGSTTNANKEQEQNISAVKHRVEEIEAHRPTALPSPSTLSDVDECSDDATTLKVVFVGAPGVDKSSIVDALTGAERAQSRRRSSGVVVRNWDPRQDDASATGSTFDESPTPSTAGSQRHGDIKFSVWDLPSGNPGGADHFATPSVFFSPNSLYVLVWDMGATNSKTRRRTYSDEFETESVNRKADRALERDIDDRVLLWVDCIGRAGGERSVILPIASSSCGGDDFECSDEVARRCEVLKKRLLNHRDKSRRTSVKPLPELMFDGHGRQNPNDQTVLRVNAEKGEGFGQLKGALMGIASGLSDSGSSFGEQLGTMPLVTTEVKKAVKHLKAQDNKVVPLDLIVSIVKDAVSTDHGVDVKAAVMACLQSLSSSGDLIYYGGKSDSFHQSRAVLSGNQEDEKNAAEPFDGLLAEFIVLSPKWLLSAVSCVLRQDLKQEIIETRNFMNSQGMVYTKEQFAEELSCSFLNERSNCPIITSKDASMLWQSMAFMRDASDKVLRSTRDPHSPMLFEYIKQLLIHRGVFVPIHMGAPSALLGGEHLPLWMDPSEKGSRESKDSTFFLVPSLLSPEPPQDVWTYKSTESWRTTICHSWLFELGTHPGMMEMLISSVLEDVFNFSSACSKRNRPLYSSKKHHSHLDENTHVFDNIRCHQVMVWKTAFLLKLGVDVDGEHESTVEVFGHLVGNDSRNLSVASDFMGSNMKRLVVSAKGQVGDGGKKIWRGGYGLVLKSLEKALVDRLGLALEKEAVCYDCLQTRRPSMANTWKADLLKSFARRGQGRIRCAHGHHVDTSLLCGLGKPFRPLEHDCQVVRQTAVTAKPVGSLLPGVVIVGLWDSATKQIKNVGSGFVADKDRGLVVTAGHVLFEMQKEKGFGKAYFGLRHGKVVIGVIPESQTNEGGATAVFRYFAEIVAHDVRNVDACVLRITTKFEVDVGGQGEGCGDQPEIPIRNNSRAMKAEKLQQLKLTKRCELEDSVRILGFNQGGEGRLQPGRHINRCADFAKGYVCKKFKTPLETSARAESTSEMKGGGNRHPKPQFVPSEEIVVMVPTINGHSGGPCVNQEGAVIGILSRADLADKQRCYLVPATELKRLIKKAKTKCMLSPLELYYLT